jgi:outer membrane PBP1 activator LpoA protein
MRPSRQRFQACVRIAVIPLLVLLSSCGSSPKRDQDPAASVQPQLQQLEAAGDYAGIAQLYLNLQGTPQQTREWQLRAAEALLEGGDNEGAASIAANIDQSALTSGQLARTRIVLSRSALLAGDHDTALANLPAYSGQLSPALQEEVLQVRVQVFAAGRLVEDELLDRLTLERIATNPRLQEMNQRALWRLLASIPDEQLQSLVSLDPELAGWVALQEVARIPLNEPDRFSERMAAWRTRFPSHTAASIAQEMDQARGFATTPSRIALLLPLSGRYATAGQAIREGFQTALEASLSIPPAVIEYDTNLQSVTELYRQAMQQGVDMVVGPLLKANVQALHDLEDRPVTILALNRASGAGDKPNIYQFGLAPEDEAAQIARDTMDVGLDRALVIAPADPWGDRLSRAFTNEFASRLGVVVATERYVPGQPEYSETVRTLLHIDRSEARKGRLQSLVGRELMFEPRRRKDANVVFLAGFAQPARLIFPQLRFYGIDKTPVVSTSSVYGGTPTQIQDRDLDGLWFVDLPWVLNSGNAKGERFLATPEIAAADAEQAVTSAEQPTGEPASPTTPTSASTSPRLFALGADAYAVLPWLAALRASPGTTFDGLTGELSVDANGHLVRRMNWARFADGLPIPRPLVAGLDS